MLHEAYKLVRTAFPLNLTRPQKFLSSRIPWLRPSLTNCCSTQGVYNVIVLLCCSVLQKYTLFVNARTVFVMHAIYRPPT